MDAARLAELGAPENEIMAILATASKEITRCTRGARHRPLGTQDRQRPSKTVPKTLLCKSDLRRRALAESESKLAVTTFQKSP
jgi:hypothetical protein